MNQLNFGIMIIYFCNEELGECSKFAKIDAPKPIIATVLNLLNENSSYVEYDAIEEEQWNDLMVA